MLLVSLVALSSCVLPLCHGIKLGAPSAAGEGPEPRRYAIAMYGGITGIRGKFAEDGSKRLSYEAEARRAEGLSKSTVNLTVPAILLKQNIGSPVDVFIHSWSPAYEKSLRRLYDPKVAHFENNEDARPEIYAMAARLPHGWSNGYYPQYGHISMVLSMSKALKLVDDYQEATGHTYDSVFLCRPDVLLRKEIDLDIYATDRIEMPELESKDKTTGIKSRVMRRAKPSADAVFHTSGISGKADFHYLMSGSSVKAFSTMFDSLPNLTKPILAHSGWVQEFLQQNKLRAVPSDTIASTDEEVYRKVEDTPEWRAVLAPLMPPLCIDKLMLRDPYVDECLVDM
jgi:hypothetical protein